MSNQLPSVQISVTPSTASAGDIRKFLAELESVAESCQTVVRNTSSGERPPTYLEPMAEKYSFAPPRRRSYEHEPDKNFSPTRLLSQLKQATKSFISSVQNIQRRL